MSNLRTFSHKGERDTECEADSISRQTHSYTAQLLLSRDGSTKGRLLLCIQRNCNRTSSRSTTGEDEAENMFEPMISQQVKALQDNYKNIVVYGSRSGKMSASLMRIWVKDVLEPVIKAEGSVESHLLISDSWSGQHGLTMVRLLDSLDSQVIVIHPRTTVQLQARDLGFNRQYKQIVKRLTVAARIQEIVANITSRAGIINIHSLVFNQLSSPAYEDLNLYSWRKADPRFDTREMTRFPAANANAIRQE